MEYPVVLLTNGHSSRFDFKVLQFLRKKQINLFVSPPDTIGVVQLLDKYQTNNYIKTTTRHGTTCSPHSKLVIERDF